MQQSFPVVKTENLMFRGLTAYDEGSVYKLFSDSQTIMFDGGITMGNILEARTFIRNYSLYNPRSGAIRWAVTNKQTGDFIGTAGFHQIDFPHRKAEIGGELLPDYWGQGFGKEMVYALIYFGFERLVLNRLTAMVIPNNKGARAVVERFFAREGTLKQWQVWGNNPVDLIIYRLLKSEWYK